MKRNTTSIMSDLFQPKDGEFLEELNFDSNNVIEANDLEAIEFTSEYEGRRSV